MAEPRVRGEERGPVVVDVDIAVDPAGRSDQLDHTEVLVSPRVARLVVEQRRRPVYDDDQGETYSASRRVAGELRARGRIQESQDQQSEGDVVGDRQRVEQTETRDVAHVGPRRRRPAQQGQPQAPQRVPGPSRCEVRPPSAALGSGRRSSEAPASPRAAACRRARAREPGLGAHAPNQIMHCAITAVTPRLRPTTSPSSARRAKAASNAVPGASVITASTAGRRTDSGAPRTTSSGATRHAAAAVSRASAGASSPRPGRRCSLREDAQLDRLPPPAREPGGVGQASSAALRQTRGPAKERPEQAQEIGDRPEQEAEPLQPVEPPREPRGLRRRSCASEGSRA